jgi:hypothetical protein
MFDDEGTFSDADPQKSLFTQNLSLINFYIADKCGSLRISGICLVGFEMIVLVQKIWGTRDISVLFPSFTVMPS